MIKLCVNEPASSAVRSLLQGDPAIVAWWSTTVECISAVQRRSREGQLSAADAAEARLVLRALADSWTEVTPSEAVRQGAERVLALHTLRAADALQLAAALVWCRRDPRGAEMVCFDARLREGAVREGFEVLPRAT